MRSKIQWLGSSSVPMVEEPRLPETFFFAEECYCTPVVARDAPGIPAALNASNTVLPAGFFAAHDIEDRLEDKRRSLWLSSWAPTDCLVCQTHTLEANTFFLLGGRMVKGGCTPRVLRPRWGIGNTPPREALPRAPTCVEFNCDELARCP